MKKQLLAGTAIVAATMFVAGGAMAQDKKMMKPSISVNGYYEAVVGGILDEDLGERRARTHPRSTPGPTPKSTSTAGPRSTPA